MSVIISPIVDNTKDKFLSENEDDLDEECQQDSLLRNFEELTEEGKIKVYVGTIEKNSTSFTLKMPDKNRSGNYSVKVFYYSQYGTPEYTYREAVEYRKRLSDELGLTKYYVASYYTRGLSIPNYVKQYICAFCDGDGCVKLGRNKREHNYVRIDFTQAGNNEPLVLNFIQNYYGGSITSYQREVKTWRRAWNLRLHVRDHINFLRDLSSFGIIKKPRADLVLSWYEKGSSSDPVWIERYNGLLTNVRDVEIQKERLTFPYLAGFFDAEGCVQLLEKGSGCISAQFTQTSCPKILHLISEITGGSVHGGILYIRSRNAKVFYPKIIEYSIVKWAQIEIVLQYCKWVSTMPVKKVSAHSEFKVRIETAIQTLKELKHDV